jgi:hypothetical protein
MSFWWVNHKQTFKAEVNNGYIWSPKKNYGGGINQTYLNLTEVHSHDQIFSFANGLIAAVGIIVSEAIDSIQPKEFGKTGDQWDEEGWLVQVAWTKLERPFKPKSKISLIAPLLPSKYSPIRPDGNGNQSCYLARISTELYHLLIGFIEELNSSLQSTLADVDNAVSEEEEVINIGKRPIPKTQKKQLIDARVGQGRFRNEVELIEKYCRLTSISNKSFLIASHIKPWKDSNDEEKLDGNNGLLLSPHVDKLFDKGYISFSDDGKILYSSKSILEIMKIWGLDSKMNVGTFNAKQKKYLQYHRETIFEKQSKKIF